MSSLMYHHSEFLGVMFGHLYPMLSGKKWNGRVNHSFLLATARMLRVTSFFILLLERFYFNGISSLMRAFLQCTPRL